MQYATIDELLELPEERAVHRHLDSLSYKWFRRFAMGFAAVAFIVILIHVIDSNYRGLILPVINLVWVRSLFVATEKSFFQARFRLILILYLLVQLAMAATYANPRLSEGLELVGFVGPFLLLVFRLTTVQYLYLFLALWAGTLAHYVAVDPSLSWRLMMQTVVTGTCLYFAVSSTRREQRRFLKIFRVEVSRNRERKRMRRELDYARQIQLSMLPASDPRIEGLDIAAISLPATEVGGDYYEYFRQGSQVALVVGDVAGHGVASGLLLSGIRSCLYLLHEDEAPSPVDILTRLNRMVRQTTDRRMFISLLYAVVDTDAGRLVLASAGHPPLLHYRAASNTLSEIRLCAPPLGTHLEARYYERLVGFEPGDVFVFSTDGVQEVLNHKGELYGDQRLSRCITKRGGSGSAREIREAILNNLWNFKGDTEQHDDITLVVVKVC